MLVELINGMHEAARTIQAVLVLIGVATIIVAPLVVMFRERARRVIR